MSEIKINDERNLGRALNSLNLFLEKKEQTYYFRVVHSPTTLLDLILVKYVDYPNCRGYVDRYILSTETPLQMESEITSIHALLMSIL